MKQFTINLTKYLPNWHAENYKIIMKEIKGDLNKCRSIHIHGSEDDIVRMAILPTLITESTPDFIKIPAGFVVEIDKLILLWTCKEPRINKTISKKKNKVGGPTFPNF